MTIFIDDSGWGNLIGGVIIGGYRQETNSFLYREIEPIYFQGENFTNKQYLSEVTRATFDIIKEFSIKEFESVNICRGYIFSSVRSKLK